MCAAALRIVGGWWGPSGPHSPPYPHLPLGLRQLEHLLPHGEESLALVLEANARGLHGLHTQLPLALPMKELDTEWWGGEPRLAQPALPPPQPPAHLQGVDTGPDVIVRLLTEGCQRTRVSLHALLQADLLGNGEWVLEPTLGRLFSRNR